MGVRINTIGKFLRPKRYQNNSLTVQQVGLGNYITVTAVSLCGSSECEKNCCDEHWGTKARAESSAMHVAILRGWLRGAERHLVFETSCSLPVVVPEPKRDQPSWSSFASGKKAGVLR
eukprot:804607-Rhodomonas_salina.2